MAEKEVCCMIAAHTTSCGQQQRSRLVTTLDIWGYLLCDITVIIFMTFSPLIREDVPVRPGLFINTIYSIKLIKTSSNELIDSLHHAKIFKLKETPPLSWENKHRFA